MKKSIISFKRIKDLFLFALLAIMTLQCSCSHKKENIEEIRLDTIRSFESAYNAIKTNVKKDAVKKNAGSLMYANAFSNTLEKLKSFKLDDFKEAIITSASLINETPDNEGYELYIYRIDPFFQIYDLEINNGEKTFVVKEDDPESFEECRKKLKYYHKLHDFLEIAFRKSYSWTPEDNEYAEIKKSDKQNWKVRFLKSGVPATEWYPVTFYDFESKEYQEAFEKFREFVRENQTNTTSRLHK